MGCHLFLVATVIFIERAIALLLLILLELVLAFGADLVECWLVACCGSALA